MKPPNSEELGPPIEVKQRPGETPEEFEARATVEADEAAEKSLDQRVEELVKSGEEAQAPGNVANEVRAVDPLVGKRGMSVAWRELPNGKKVGMIGQVEASSSTSEGPAGKAQFDAMVNSGKYDYVIGQRSLRRSLGWEDLGSKAGDTRRLIPDIVDFRSDGLIDVFEVASKSRMSGAGRAAFQSTLDRIRAAIPAAQRGVSKIID